MEGEAAGTGPTEASRRDSRSGYGKNVNGKVEMGEEEEGGMLLRLGGPLPPSAVPPAATATGGVGWWSGAPRWRRRSPPESLGRSSSEVGSALANLTLN